MGYLKEKVSYLRGMADGMQLSDATNEGKLLKAMLEVMDEMAEAVESVEDVQDQLGDQVDNIDEDLGEIERILYSDGCCDDEDCDCDCDDECVAFEEIECPHCGESIEIDVDVLGEDGTSISCPSCNKEIELEWECSCGCEHEEE